ncbi:MULTISPECIES: metallophosphoesterase [Rhodomicrobium]|uniref:metallophosphoesterase family protein n=1 Tax=Rhodomicrobium TaxID=1068 RepID=UPI000B4C1A2A|nr:MULTISPECIES: metallophosphoesterase [Rhodomicrobium]
MTRIVLLADLHFGSVPPELAIKLTTGIAALAPDLIVVAGDLTMRSRRSEFSDAKLWLASVAAPLLMLPGNHDLPVWNIFERFANPFARYSRVTGQSLMPVFEDDHCFILGLNTTASWQPSLNWQEGTARRRDVEAARKLLAEAPPGKARIVATHHPLVAVEGFPRARPVRRAAGALAMLGAERVEMLLSGHIHQTYAVPLAEPAPPMIAVGAPTALSTRMRGEPNGFWLIEVGPERFSLCLHSFDGKGFAPTGPARTFARAVKA